MTDIFLSYNENDRETARRVAAMLESVGWTVWWDRRIPAGETWREVLEKALDEMRCMIVLWSAHSIESEWVCEEASEGREQDKLVPVLIEAVRPPAGFREIQAADLTHWDGTREFEGMRMLIADLENLLGKPEVTAPRQPAPADAGGATGTHARNGHGRPYERAEAHAAKPTAPAPEPAPRRRLMAWIIAAALLLAGVAAYFVLSARDTGVRRPPLTETPRRVPGLRAPAEVAPVTPAPPASATVAPEPAPQSTESTESTPKPAAPPAATRPIKERPAIRRGTAARAASARCADLLARVQLGETLSEEARAEFRKECQQ
jgi:hypothetical protein